MNPTGMLADGLCALVLAAGEGTRLRPITETIPKALCPVANVPLLDRALARLAAHGLVGPDTVAVNASYLREQVRTHVGDRAYVSVEPGPPALGTAGAVAYARGWIAGRAVLVGNADAYLDPSGPVAADLTGLLEGWDGQTVRILCVPAHARAGEFGSLRFAGFSLLPASVAAGLPMERSELVLAAWRPAERAGLLELLTYDGFYLDTGTIADYLAANLHAAGERSVIAPDAVVAGRVERSMVGDRARVLGSLSRSVVLPDGFVAPDEHLVDAVRIGHSTTARPPGC